jgi:hypothetical protein
VPYYVRAGGSTELRPAPRRAWTQGQPAGPGSARAVPALALCQFPPHRLSQPQRDPPAFVLGSHTAGNPAVSQISRRTRLAPKIARLVGQGLRPAGAGPRPFSPKGTSRCPSGSGPTATWSQTSVAVPRRPVTAPPPEAAVKDHDFAGGPGVSNVRTYICDFSRSSGRAGQRPGTRVGSCPR